MIVHAFMIELDQVETIDIQEKLKIVKNLCSKSMESCSVVVPQILAVFCPIQIQFNSIRIYFHHQQRYKVFYKVYIYIKFVLQFVRNYNYSDLWGISQVYIYIQ